MTDAQRLARHAVRRSYDDLSDAARAQLKILGPKESWGGVLTYKG